MDINHSIQFQEDLSLKTMTIEVLRCGRDYFAKIDKVRGKYKHHWKTRHDIEQKHVQDWLKITGIESLDNEENKELVRLYLGNRYARKRTPAQQELHDQGKIIWDQLQSNIDDLIYQIYGAPTTDFLPIPEITKKSMYFFFIY